MRGKIKYKPKKRRVIKVWYIVILLVVVLLCISASYSLFNSELTINGTAILNKKDPELPIEVTPTEETTENGGTRYSTNTSMTFWGIELYTVESEEYEENSVTTNLRQTYKATFGFTTATPSITLTITNNTSVDYTDGAVKQVEKQDTNSCFQSSTPTVSSQTIPAGGSATVTIKGTLKANKSPASGTYYKYAITYKINGVTRYFYYTINFLPKS